MSYHDRNAGYGPPRDLNESQHQSPPREEDERARSYYKNDNPRNGSVSLPPITPYDNVYPQQQPPGFPQEQRVYPETYRQATGSAYPQEYTRSGEPSISFGPAAPRQRTAIACRYCRRRKIRCSGFDHNPDGRCVNCQRFQQECIFTPVSSQAQAFVPAHAVYPSMRNMSIGPDGRPRPMYPPGAPLFGAHGQPLPAPQMQPGPPYEYPAPSPTGSYSSYGIDEYSSVPPSDPSRNRLSIDQHHPSILPPIPGQLPYPRAEGAHRGNIDDDLRLPPVTPTVASSIVAHSPGSSQPSRHPHHQHGMPYISHTSPSRTSPVDGRVDPMSLGNIMERRPDMEIDRNMLGRLGRRGQ
ncbi:hypothetical protein GcM1_248188 [Golovinomyces cichoracearum]|uniref:Zn(2)-C6 fungal-type domain-containing protein n=1 Tax=Golovinomyces cichoracearum TaxID=62708 RepID=A0A420ID61_9PEZI|nr:hypothetical protein GcM1_248188 [Golovinomyces cichoracearum]